jgi:hypothetical protein
MMRINTTATANISKMWIKPPNVYEVTIPSSQRTISKTKIVQSMEHLQIAIPCQFCDGAIQSDLPKELQNAQS